VAPLPTPLAPALPPHPDALTSEGGGGEETNLDWVETALQDEELRARFIAAVSDPQLYTDAELAQLQAGLLMESEVNLLRQTVASGLSQKAKALKTIKTSSLIDNAVAMVSKDGRDNIVQVSGTIRASLMSVVAYQFCAEQGHNQILMEEETRNIHRVVQHENSHSYVFHFGFKLPSPVRDRDGVLRCISQKQENGDCINSFESIEHHQVPHQDGVARAYGRRLFRFSPISPTVTRFTATSVFDLGGSIPRVISNSLTTPAAARAPLDALRYFNQVKRAESFETADAKELGQLLVLDTDNVRGKWDPDPLEAKLRTFVNRSAVLRGARSTCPWIEVMLKEVLRNRLRVPKGSRKALEEFAEEDARKAGRGLANALIANATAEAAVDEWLMTYPALRELEQR
jgi:hypothetical protein